MKTLNKTALFLIFTFVINFSLVGIYKLFGGNYLDRLGFTIIATIYMFIPTVSVFIVKKIILHEKMAKDLLVSFKINKWYLVAWLLMPVISFLTLGISLLFPNVVYSSEMLGFIKRFEFMLSPEQIEHVKGALETLPINPILLTLLSGLMGGITLNAIAGFGEELGWRGLLLNEFKEMKFFKASLVIGFIWGIWHLPLILMGHNYPQHPQIGVFMMVIWCVLLTPLFIYITIKSKSVIAAAILHGTVNGTSGLTIMFTDGGNDLTIGMTGFAGFIALLLSLLCLFIYDYFISKEKILLNKISNYL
jgi:membrane protease YdiL (CAAX protease family)